jgi:hypothetical protein
VIVHSQSVEGLNSLVLMDKSLIDILNQSHVAATHL